VSDVLTYYRTAELPDIQLWLLDDDGALIDYSSGYTFTFKLGDPGSAAVFTKTSGITGAAGSGSESSGTPNITLTFTAAELDDVDPGAYTWQLVARHTSSSKDRPHQGRFMVRDVIT
jgi:hypothetical protein